MFEDGGQVRYLHPRSEKKHFVSKAFKGEDTTLIISFPEFQSGMDVWNKIPP